VNTASFVSIHHLAVENGTPRLGGDVELLDHAWVIAISVGDVAGDVNDLLVVGVIESNHRPSHCAGRFDPQHRCRSVRNAAQVAVLTNDGFGCGVSHCANGNSC
ncbi:MAG: hypothetical protein ACK56I_06645, partial [bacterium]